MDPVDLYSANVAEALEVSEPINVKEFLESWSDLLSKDELTLQDCSSLPLKSFPSYQNLLPQDILEELFIVTNPVLTLYPDGRTPGKMPQLDEVPDHANLATVRNTAAHLSKKRSKDSVQYKIASVKALKYHYKSDEHYNKEGASVKSIKDCFTAEPQKLQFPEAIVTIDFRRSAKTLGATGDSVKRGIRAVRFQAVTSNTLAELRDVFKCPKDFEIPGDFSSSPEDVSKITSRAREIFPSGLFFINNCFYVDNRYIKAKDYSRDIIDWLKKKGSTKEYPVFYMNSTRILDLTVKLGHPYLYLHQGDCEHIFQFNDLRLMSDEDCPYTSAYPLQIRSRYHPFVVCNTCQVRAVRWMVTNSTLSPTDPAHYCDACFKRLHYDPDGNKICDFQAFCYSDNDFVADM